ncbi:MAG TPA: FG-GAP-like repeat-containing protein [Actinoplanes sp.]|nr:FG-GAP-like repeat-containing protein [Actinoplanes sp.]
MTYARTLAGGLAAISAAVGSTVAVVAPAPAAAAAVPVVAAAAKRSWTRTSDFNGDGFADLAVGAPGATVAGHAGAGYVAVIPGSRRGLEPAKKKIFSQATRGVPGSPAEYRWFGESLATADLNGDTYADLIVGTPRDTDTPDGIARPGSLTIFFGSKSGLGRPQRILGKAGLGSAVTAADMNGDGRPEVVATETPSNFGRVVRFTVAKKSFKAVRTATEPVYGLGGIAGGDVNGDGYDDVVTLFRQVGGSQSFALFTGSKAGLSAEPASVHVHEGGADLALGDLNRDGRADLVVGRPVARFGIEATGEVYLFWGTQEGFAEEADRVINQDSAGVPETAEEYDQFGSAVAIGDLTGDGNPELVIGAQRETLGTIEAAGAVTVMRGSVSGPSAGKAQFFARGAGGLGGKKQLNEQFGWLATIRDFNGDRKSDLAVTAIGGNASAEWPYYGDGSVTVLNGSAKGAVGKGAKVITPKSVGTSATDAKFGWSLGR